MNKHTQLKALSLACLLSAQAFGIAQAKDVDSAAAMFTDGTAALNLRYRYEHVDQDGISKHANASTLRSRLTLTTARYAGFSASVEVDDVSHMGAERHNTLSNGKTTYPVVADPDGTDLNQAWLRYSGDAFALTAGRQRILHDSQRFLGGVAWRQNEQTYDALRLELPGVGPFTLDYSYIHDVNRIFGPDTGGAQPRRFDSDSHAFRAGFSAAEGHELNAFAYLLDFDNGAAASSQTYGLDYSGKLGPAKISATYAKQTDYRDNPADYDADYYFAEVSLPIKPLVVAAGYEVLGSDDGRNAFLTPLATLHKFQGWADQYLVTPSVGVKDAYLKVAGKAGKAKLALFYHDFSAEEGGADQGLEWDFVATLPITRQFSTQLKYANFQSNGGFKADVEKVWFTLNFKY